MKAKIVLLPYKFTLLSNKYLMVGTHKNVLLPYKFTLLSNRVWLGNTTSVVLLPYKFTLLSNEALTQLGIPKFYYPINLHYSQTNQNVYR